MTETKRPNVASQKPDISETFLGLAQTEYRRGEKNLNVSTRTADGDRLILNYDDLVAPT